MRSVASIIVAAVAAIGLVRATEAAGQIANRLGVSEDIFATYARARQNAFDVGNIAIADSLYHLGEERSEAEVRMLALNLALSARYVRDGLVAATEVAEEAEKLYEERPETADIYYVIQMIYTQFLIIENKRGQALDVAQKILHNATATGNKYGLYITYRTLALVYTSRLNIQQSLACYESALSLVKDADAEADRPNLEFQLCDALVNNQVDMERAGGLIETLRSYTEDERYSYLETSLDGICLNYYFTRGEYKAVQDIYAKMTADPNYESRTGQNERTLQKAIYDMAAGNYQAIIDLADTTTTPDAMHSIKEHAYINLGDYEHAYEERKLLMAARDSNYLAIQSEDLAAANARADNEALKAQAENMRIRQQLMAAMALLAISVIVIVSVIMLHIRNRRHIRQLAQAHTQTAEALRKAEKANEMKSQFIRNMYHEFRTPLNSVSGFAELIGTDEVAADKETRMMMSGELVKNARQIVALMDDVIMLSHLDSMSEPPAKEPIIATEFIDTLMSTAPRPLTDKVEMRTDIVLPQGFTFVSNNTMVGKILTNLMANSVKFTEEGSITLSARVHQKSLQFAVTDTGIGIPAGMEEKIFERFFKVDTFSQGTGLGLPLCQEMAKLIGATIELDTTHEAPGCRFVLTIPEI